MTSDVDPMLHAYDAYLEMRRPDAVVLPEDGDQGNRTYWI